jgi:hypothetical protein
MLHDGRCDTLIREVAPADGVGGTCGRSLIIRSIVDRVV